jgi:acyl-CoA dehydrogenase
MTMLDAPFAEGGAGDGFDRGGDWPGVARWLGPTSSYRFDLREIEFVLWEFFRIQESLGQAPCEKIARSDVESLFGRAMPHVARLAEANRAGDRDPARLLDDGSVYTPKVFDSLWEEHRRDWFWLRQQIDGSRHVDRGGRQFPHLVIQLLGELFLGANPSFMTYAGFTPAGATLIRKRGTHEQQAIFLEKLDSVTWDACFAATEPNAGSDLIAIETYAAPLEGDVYEIHGEKCYITAGQHGLTENTVHIVLARTRKAASGPLSLSCFLVPRLWPQADGTLVPNGVRCTEVVAKMGLNGCANTRLSFGADGQTRGFLLGGKENVALLQMAHMMRLARIGTGQIGLALASTSYLNALDYARTRIQGARFDEAANPRATRVAIIEHPDVQRMLLDMKSRVEGARILLGRISDCGLRLHQMSLSGASQEEVAKVERLAVLLAPVAKAHISDESWHVISLALQVYGAKGYLQDLPIEQNLRDARILSIWEGTNYIQAQDLIRDKLRLGGESLLFLGFRDAVRASIEQARGYECLVVDADKLASALDGLQAVMAAIGRQASAQDYLPVAQFCTRVMGLFGAVSIGWGLLDAARVAAAALDRNPGSEEAFYLGKLKTAHYYMANVVAEALARVPDLCAMADGYIHMTSEEFGAAGEGGPSLRN